MFRGVCSSNLRFGAWLTADSIINYVNTNLSTLVLARHSGASVAGGYNLAYNVAVVPPMKLNPSLLACCSGVRQNSGRYREAARDFTSCSPWW
ncbi:oligosaccharide flippase family protein [Shigella flexneri]